MLDKEFKYFVDNQKELVKKFNGRYIVIKGERVIADYTTEIEAYTETQKEHQLGTFLIQLCTPGEDTFTQTYHSRVIFA